MGTIEMTLVRPCVRYSVRLSVRLRSCLRNSDYIFHRIHWTFCRHTYYDMKIWMWFWNFHSAIFDGVIAHADLRFAYPWACLHKVSYIFHRIYLKLCRLFITRSCQGQWWGLNSRNFEDGPWFSFWMKFLLVKEILKIYVYFSAAGVVPCESRKKPPRTSSIVPIIFSVIWDQRIYSE